jgi:pimeloyl-ACP methyl ester carboxylesterase
LLKQNMRRMILIGIAVVVLLLALSAAITLIGTRWIERAHPPAGKFIEVAGARLHVTELDRRARPSPDDLPMLLIHGASGNLEDMRLALGDRLAARHRVILADRPGHGWSARLDADGISPARQAAMLSELLERLDIGRAIVVGHSFGGTVATAMALDDPFRVAGLVLIAPVAYPWSTGIAWYYSLAATPVIGPLFARTLALPAGALLMPLTVNSVFAPQSAPPDYLQRTATALVLRPQNFLDNARDVAGLLAYVTAQAPRYAALAMPTVLIAGDRDDIVSPERHSRGMAADVPHSKLVILEGIGHMPHHVAPDRVVAAIEEVATQAVGAAR